MSCYRLKRGFYKCILVSMVMLHVIIALASIVLVTYSLIKPSRHIITVDWIAAAATMVSGIALVALEPARMLHVCVAGLVYITVISILILIAGERYKLLRKQNSNL